MNKENNMSAASSAARLRRSAVVERIRLREEWSALKGTELQQANKNTNILTKKQAIVKAASVAGKKESTRNMNLTNDALRGVVALVEVGTECRALPMRAALSALGASVLPSWNPLVTHLVWSQGGCRATRARARALACRLVSPLWVEACAAASKRLPEQAFPAAARASDLPSPRTLRRLLKKAEMENIPITDLLNSSNEENPKLRLRISSDTERDTTDTSRDTTGDTKMDTTNDTSTDAESRVNTAPRRALPASPPSPRVCKSRRKLFTHREADLTIDNDDSDESTTIPKPRKPSLIKKPVTVREHPKLTQKNRRELARAERMAKKLVAAGTPGVTQSNTHRGLRPRIVLTGMSRGERRSVAEAVKALGGRLQAAVDRRTTHVLLGTCSRTEDHDRTGLTGITNLCTPPPAPAPRTLAALCGAARGCRVLRARWALHCRDDARWRHHAGYEVPYLNKVSQKARLERAALGKLRSEYAYDVFNGMRVRLAPDAEQCSAAEQLLHLCGAVVLLGRGPRGNDEAQNGGRTQQAIQNGAHTKQCQQGEHDIIIGKQNGDISSKWVFDSVAAGRMRTTRRYVFNSLSESDLVTQMERIRC